MFDFSEFTQVQTLENVPEQFHGMYVEVKDEDSGDVTGFSIADHSKGAVESIIGLNKSLIDSRKETKNLKGMADLADLSPYGTTPSEIAASVENMKKGYEDQLLDSKDAKLNFETLKADLQAGHSVEIKALTDKNSRVEKQLFDVIVRKEAQSAIMKEKGKELLLPFVLEAARVKDEEGEIKVYIVDDNNTIRHSPVTGKPLTITEHVQSMKTDERYGVLFESDNSDSGGGGGTPPRSTSQPAPPTAKPVGANDKIATALKNSNAIPQK